PADLGLLAILRGNAEMGMSEARALAILMVRDPDRMFVGDRIARVPIVGPSDVVAATTGFAIVELDAGEHESAIHHVDAGGSFLVFGDLDDEEEEPGYVSIGSSKTFVDVDLEAMIEELAEAQRAQREGRLAELLAPILGGEDFERVRKEARTLRERSHF